MIRMMFVIACGIAGFAFDPAGAVCTSYPYTLTNGTVANADQVMANFNCAQLTGNGIFSGSVGIGTTTPADMLDVNGAAVIGPLAERLSLGSGAIGFNRRTSDGAIYSSSAYAYQLSHIQGTTPTTDYLAVQIFKPTGAAYTGSALTINGQGNVGIGVPQSTLTFMVSGTAGGTGGWTNTSDVRLKKNIEQISGALQLVTKLRGVRFDWREPNERSVGQALTLPTGERQIGFIAQEVEKIVPEAVSKPINQDATYGLRQDNLIPVLVEAIKEQQAEIEQLRSDLALLKR